VVTGKLESPDCKFKVFKPEKKLYWSTYIIIWYPDRVYIATEVSVEQNFVISKGLKFSYF